MTDQNDLLTLEQTARYIKLSSLTLRRWNKKGLFVPIVRLGIRGNIYYKKSDVDAFLKKRQEKYL